MDEKVGRSLGNESLGENLSILGVPQIRAGVVFTFHIKTQFLMI